MKNTGRTITYDGKPGANRVFDAVLIVEVRNAGLAVRGSDGCIHIMLNAGLPREARQALALLLFTLDPRFPRVLHGEDTPYVLQYVSQ